MYYSLLEAAGSRLELRFFRSDVDFSVYTSFTGDCVRFHIGTKIEEGRVECSPCEGLYVVATGKPQGCGLWSKGKYIIEDNQ